jgi:hypothetical protein
MPQNSFDAAIEIINNSAAEANIRAALQRWHDDPSSGLGRIIVPNVIDREHFLDPLMMQELLKALLTVATEPVDKIKDTYEIACRKLKLKGGLIRSAPHKYPPVLLGRAVDRERLVSFLEQHYGPAPTYPHPFFPFFVDSDDVRLFVQGLIAGTIEDAAKFLFMSEFGTWVTWRDDADDSPFSWMTQRISDEVRAGMGLDGQSLGEILLLEYRASDVARLFRPTIADAELFEYFEPPASTHDWYGRTRPWPVAMAQARPVPVVAPPASHPEALHERISFTALILPVTSLL